MRKFVWLLMIAFLSGVAQDYDCIADGFSRFTQKVDFVDQESGLKFAIGGLDTFGAFLMGPEFDYVDVRGDNDCPNHWETFGLYEEGEFPAATIEGAVIIPDGVSNGQTFFLVQRLSYMSFNKCQSMTSVELSWRTLQYRRKCFNECTSLAEVTFRYPGKNINPAAYVYPDVFKGCTSLKKVDMRFAYWVYNGIFRDCPSLEDVTLFVNKNQGNAFNGRSVPSLKKLTLLLPTGAESLGSFDKVGFFQEEYDNCQVVVPQGKLEAFRAHPVWGRFRNLLEETQAGAEAPETTCNWTVQCTGELQYRVRGDFAMGAVYDLAGIKVCDISGEEASFTVPRHGLFVVTIDGASQKVIF